MADTKIFKRGIYFNDFFSYETKHQSNPLRRRSTAHSFLKRKTSSETSSQLRYSPGSKPCRAAHHSCSPELRTATAAGPWPAAAPSLLDRHLDLGLEQADIGLVHAETDIKAALQTSLTTAKLRVFLKAKYISKCAFSYRGDIAERVLLLLVPNELQHCLAKRQLQKQVEFDEYAHFTPHSPTQNQSLRKDRDSDIKPLTVIKLKLPVILCPQRPSMEDHVIERQP